MPTLRITVTADIDGATLDGFPFTHMVQTNVSQPFEYQLPNTGGTPATLPDSLVTTLQALIVRVDKNIAIGLNGSPPIVNLNPGGMLLILDCSQPGDANGPKNILQNATALLATIKGVAMGA